ncbi:MAG TPA: hypothetical protein H9899_07495 [Candidatus Sphingomonas excrementigallinarum]|nr:hypothetical protein [Candidatus Sphingomonas excrementigallinarum]
MTLGVFSADDRLDDAVLMAAVQGAFHGANLPAARIEGLIAAHVPRKHIAEVADVYGTKWWDYRRLSPGHSFYLFAHHHYKAMKVAAAKFRWHRAQTGRNGAGVGLIGVNTVHYTVDTIWERDAAHISGMWNAMKMADALGIPYDQFNQLGNQVALDMLWKRLPTPAQLYGAKIGAHMLDRWETLIKDRMFTARHPLYALDNYAGLEVQDNYQAWLIERIEERRDPTTAIATTVFRTPQLPEHIARRHFPANTIDRARLLAA